ncbi:MAG: MarR family transcriptional regulator [Candidatus Bathyarchaeota archaeon]|nr:MAG: MarR family transcriptional regulator [Candidatus Bathyarchaeota archaeon]
MYDLFLAMTILLLFATGVASILYYDRIKRAYRKYEEAKEIVDDVIISFSKQLQTQERRLAVVTRRIEVAASQSERTERRMKVCEGQLTKFTTKMQPISEIEQRTKAYVKNINKRMSVISTNQETITQKIERIEKVGSRFTVPPEVETEAAISIKREHALAPLTQTELNVLEIIAVEGGKTAPEIKERVKLTREHTARLMKKLYVEGYLERDVRKIPYVYNIKKEMKRLLRNESRT